MKFEELVPTIQTLSRYFGITFAKLMRRPDNVIRLFVVFMEEFRRDLMLSFSMKQIISTEKPLDLLIQNQMETTLVSEVRGFHVDEKALVLIRNAYKITHHGVESGKNSYNTVWIDRAKYSPLVSSVGVDNRMSIEDEMAMLGIRFSDFAQAYSFFTAGFDKGVELSFPVVAASTEIHANGCIYHPMFTKNDPEKYMGINMHLINRNEFLDSINKENLKDGHVFLVSRNPPTRM